MSDKSGRPPSWPPRRTIVAISPLSDAVYQEIVGLIEGERLARGHRLPGEHALATRFGVSRPVLRQALARLRAEGWVTSRQGAGNFVGESPALRSVTFGPLRSLADLRSFFEFRTLLEEESAALAARCQDRPLVREVSTRCRALERARARGESGIEEDIAFHLAIAQASGNRFFVMTMSALADQMRFAIGLVRQLTPPLAERIVRVRDEHRGIEEAIARGDADAAREAMDAHQRGGMARLFGD